MTDDRYPTYPHLENLDRVPQVLEAPYVHVSEKLHGFNARLGRTADGETWIGTRNLVVTKANDTVQGFAPWAQSVVDRVPDGVTLFGEWIGKGIQKGIDYGDKRFVLFAAREGTELLHPGSLFEFAALIGAPVAPVLHEGTPLDISMLDLLRHEKSALAEEGREGIVLVPWPSIFDVYGHQIIAKFKAPAFAERAHARRELPTPADLANVTAFVEDYATSERLSHVLDQLAEQGLDGRDRRNTGALLRAMYDDVVRESGPDHDALSDSDKKALGKVLNAATKWLLDELVVADLTEAAA